jgi:uncharacterized membrane protein
VERILALALTVGAVLWVGALLIASIAASGGAGLGLLTYHALYDAARHVCHQLPSRSFHVASVSLPVCARCLGLYLGGMSGALCGWPGPPRMPFHIRRILLLAAVPTALTFAVEWFGFVSPTNRIRFAAALPLGALAGWIFVRMLRAEARKAP